MKKRAFTLIELLVVIAIIAILAVIIIVNLNSAKAKAKRSQVLETFGNVLTASNACVASGESLTTIHGGTSTPHPLNPSCGVCQSGSVAQVNWPGTIENYAYRVLASASKVYRVTDNFSYFGKPFGPNNFQIVCLTDGIPENILGSSSSAPNPSQTWQQWCQNTNSCQVTSCKIK